MLVIMVFTAKWILISLYSASRPVAGYDEPGGEGGELGHTQIWPHENPVECLGNNSNDRHKPFDMKRRLYHTEMRYACAVMHAVITIPGGQC